MPTYSQGTVIPDMSDLMWRNSESGAYGRTVKFHGSVEYGSRGFFSMVGKPLPWVVECMSAPYSTSTVSVTFATECQNSRSTSSSVTGFGALVTGSKGILLAKWFCLN